MEKVLKSKGELEALCVVILRSLPGMQRISNVRIVRYSGFENWSWEIAAFEGEISESAFKSAVVEVRKLQREYNLD